jgi:response regulator RpfG family c-di-GMP phosphodiesterase
VYSGEVCAHFDDAPDGHDERVGELSQRLALELGVEVEEAHRIGLAARLHDVGKIAVRGEILGKPGALTDFETDVARRHTVLGALMLSGSRLPVLRLAEQIALCHHERWDGRGYPNRLAGEAIPLAARIVAVADVFDALLHERAYQPAWPLAAAVAEVGLQRERHFDPCVVEAFLRVAQRGQLPFVEAPPALPASAGAERPGGTRRLVRARRELSRLGFVAARGVEVA